MVQREVGVMLLVGIAVLSDKVDNIPASWVHSGVLEVDELHRLIGSLQEVQVVEIVMTQTQVDSLSLKERSSKLFFVLEL